MLDKLEILLLLAAVALCIPVIKGHKKAFVFACAAACVIGVVVAIHTKMWGILPFSLLALTPSLSHQKR